MTEIHFGVTIKGTDPETMRLNPNTTLSMKPAVCDWASHSFSALRWRLQQATSKNVAKEGT